VADIEFTDTILAAPIGSWVSRWLRV